MYESILENSLIRNDIVDLLANYVSIQPDIDEDKVKAAAIVAQNVDLKRIIKKEGLDRVKDPQNDTDKELLLLILGPWCYYTYSRLLRMFQGVFTDGGYITGGDERNSAKSVSNEMSSIAEQLMLDVIVFMEAEDTKSVDKTKMTPKIRVFGGKECR